MTDSPSPTVMVTARGILREVEDALESGDIDSLRRYILDYYAAETPYAVASEGVERIMGVLATYLEDEEVFGDSALRERLTRVRQVMAVGLDDPEHILFALEFNEIRELLSDLNAGRICEEVFSSRLRARSPVPLDWDRILRWSLAHRRRREFSPDLLA